MEDAAQVARTAQQWLSPERIQGYIQEYALPVLFAIIILILGAWGAKLVRKVVRKVMGRRELDPIVIGFVANFAYIMLMVFVILAALERIGVKTTSFVAIIGAAGLAIGLALQGSLANFAAGFLMVVFRPFKKGDYIEAGGTAGVVDEIQVFSTVLNTPDNCRVVVPNSKIMSDNITNYSANETRRLDLVFGVGYADDLRKVKAVLQKIADADERVLRGSRAADRGQRTGRQFGQLHHARVGEVARLLGIQVRHHREGEARASMQEGISIPFPQRDVHLIKAKRVGTGPQSLIQTRRSCLVVSSQKT